MGRWLLIIMQGSARGLAVANKQHRVWRARGGQNTARWLMLPGSWWKTSWLSMPKRSQPFKTKHTKTKCTDCFMQMNTDVVKKKKSRSTGAAVMRTYTRLTFFFLSDMTYKTWEWMNEWSKYVHPRLVDEVRFQYEYLVFKRRRTSRQIRIKQGFKN